MRHIGWYLFALVVGSGLAGSSRAEAVILINEVLFNPGGLDVNGDGTASATGDEFIELVNTGALPVSLEGWRLNDALATRHVFGAGVTMPGLGFVVVFGSNASSGTLALNNSGDTVSLFDPSATLVDQLIYSQALTGASLTRSPDGSGPFADHRTVSELPFSPGLTTSGERLLDAPDQSPQPAVPEPASSLLFGIGALALGIRRRHGGMTPRRTL